MIRIGILGIATMKRLIKPSEKNDIQYSDIQYLSYTSREKLSEEYENGDGSLNTAVEIAKKQVIENRKKADVYIISNDYKIYDAELNL